MPVALCSNARTICSLVELVFGMALSHSSAFRPLVEMVPFVPVLRRRSDLRQEHGGWAPRIACRSFAGEMSNLHTRLAEAHRRHREFVHSANGKNVSIYVATKCPFLAL